MSSPFRSVSTRARRSAGFLALAALGTLLASCTSPASPADAGPDVPADALIDAPVPHDPSVALATLAQDETGQTLARAYRDHIPTAAESRLAVAFWLLVVDAQLHGETHPLLLNPNLRARLADSVTLYPSLYAPASQGTGMIVQHLISNPPQCTDNCRPSSLGVLRALAVLASRLTPAAQTLEGAAARFILLWSRRTDIGTATADQIGDSVIDADMEETLNTIGSVVVPATAIERAARDLGLSTVDLGRLGQVGAVAGAFLGGYALGTELNNEYSAYSACRDWQAMNCPMDAGPDGSMDGSMDAAPDVAMDAGTDAMDAGTDAMDAGTDAMDASDGGDSGHDGGDSGHDGGDSGHDAATDVSTDTWNGGCAASAACSAGAANYCAMNHLGACVVTCPCNGPPAGCSTAACWNAPALCPPDGCPNLGMGEWCCP